MDHGKEKDKMHFQRGKDPAEALKIGKFSEIKKGDYFHVRFRERRSCTEYYSLQKNEREGIPADARAKDDEQINFAGRRVVHCVVNTIAHETFTAGWSRKEKCWIIGVVEDESKYTDDTGPL